jgi:hypothetical protein
MYVAVLNVQFLARMQGSAVQTLCGNASAILISAAATNRKTATQEPHELSATACGVAQSGRLPF